jgi:L-ribulose-5-phosphate 3-epimerase
MSGAARFGINTYSYMLQENARACVLRWAEKGFHDFEIMMHPGHLWPDETTSSQRKELRRTFEESGIRVVTLNMPNVDLNVAGTTAEMRAYSLGIIEKIVELAGDLGVAGVVIGPGKPNPLMPAPRERLTSYFLTALDRLAPVAERSGTALWVENMPFSFLPDAFSIMRVLDTFADPAIGVVYDLANAYFIHEDAEEGVKAVRRCLKLVHISDTPLEAYRHSPIGTGTLPIASIPRILHDSGYGDVLMLEIVSEEPDAAIIDSCERLKRLDWRGAAVRLAS